MLSGMPSVEVVPFGALLLDTNEKISPALAKAIASAVDHRNRPLGIRGVIRYLSLGSPGRLDLDASEVSGLHDAGLGVMAVQHAHGAGWAPSAQRGTQDGLCAAANAHHAALAVGCTVGCDLEGVATDASPQAILDFAAAWWESAKAYLPALYVGYQCGLTGEELMDKLPFQRYWSAGSIVPTPTRRGFCCWQVPPLDQTLQTTAGPLKYDLDIVGRDWLGGAPCWQVP